MISAINDLLNPHLEKIPLLFTTQGTIIGMLMNVYIAKVFQVVLSVILVGKYDNVQASHRVSSGEKDGKKLSFGAKMAQRAWNAHLNSWESFSAFSAAVILALVTVGDSHQLRVLANAFVVVRFAYIIIYVAAFNDVLALLRGGAFAVGISLLLQIFVLAAGENWKTF
mmetsp:Transcript_28009/g.55992  ORF Transcript_28009/g.55992 Transcript_28009/m.55992 type:complete len:168 (+) Transcript_28009:24-527(+)